MAQRYMVVNGKKVKLPKGSTEDVATFKDRSHLNPLKWGKR